MPQQVFIDSDFGIDDVTALLVCLKHSDYSETPAQDALQVCAVSLVDGNVTLPSAFACAKTVMALVDIPEAIVPVIAGADGPLMPGLLPKVCWEGHGKDGMGNFTFREDEWSEFCKTHLPGYTPEPLPAHRSEIAAVELVKRASASPGTLTVLALGPLTNVAIAISLDKNFLKNLKSLVVMGGSTEGKGNSGRSSEFNFYCDPEAAHVVFHTASLLDDIKITLVPWETTVDHAFPWSYFDELVGRVGEAKRAPSKSCAFLQGYISHAEQLVRAISEKGACDESNLEQYHLKFNQFLMCDLYAAACVVDPSSVLESKNLHCQIELGGLYSRGSCAFDWHNFSGMKPNCKVVFKMDDSKIKSMLLKTFQ